ncbi:MAG: Ig-like domain-containing protein [Gemmatimonadaceae bacterium]
MRKRSLAFAAVAVLAGACADPVGPRATDLPSLLTGGNVRIDVSPSATTLAVGDSMQFDATVFLNSAPWPLRRIRWESTDRKVAIVTFTGMVRAVGPGQATIRAWNEGTAGTSVVTVANPPAASGPADMGQTTAPPAPPKVPNDAVIAAHEPAGYSQITSRGFATKAAQWGDYAGSEGWWPEEAYYPNLVLHYDNSAPASGPEIIRYLFQPGLMAGTGPASMSYVFGTNGPGAPPAPREIYISIWFRFSNPFLGEGLQKLFYLNWSGGSMIAMAEGLDHNPLMASIFVNHAALQNAGNLYSGAQISRGAWHNAEYVFGLSSSPNARDGVVRMWLDGVKYIDRNDYPFSGNNAVSEVRFATIWGGGGHAPLTINQYLDFDHIYLSGR